VDAGAELIDINVLLGHESIATTQIYTNVGQSGWRRWWRGCESRCLFMIFNKIIRSGFPSLDKEGWRASAGVVRPREPTPLGRRGIMIVPD